MTTAMAHPELTGHVFEAFIKGHAAYQARNEFAQQITAGEARLVSLIRNGALGGIDQLEPSLLTSSDNPGLALDSLRLLADKARLERVDQRLATDANNMANLVMGREVCIEAIDRVNSPIDRYYYSSGFVGPHRYELSESPVQKARGRITETDLQRGVLWVISMRGTGRIGRFLTEPTKWRVAMPTDVGDEPLIRIDFVGLET